MSLCKSSMFSQTDFSDSLIGLHFYLEKKVLLSLLNRIFIKNREKGLFIISYLQFVYLLLGRVASYMPFLNTLE